MNDNEILKLLENQKSGYINVINLLNSVRSILEEYDSERNEEGRNRALSDAKQAISKSIR